MTNITNVKGKILNYNYKFLSFLNENDVKGKNKISKTKPYLQ